MDDIALVLIGHGSKLPHNRENLVKLAEILRKKSQFKTVELSFMVRNTPTIPEAIESIVDIIEEKALKALGQKDTEEKTAPDASKLKPSVDTFAKSIVIIRKELGNTLANVPKENVPVIERVVHTTADPEFAKLLVFSDGAVKAGVA